MKKMLSIVLFASMLFVVFATPSPAFAERERTGERFRLLSGEPTTFQAGEPFYFEHGWRILPSTTHPAGRYLFELEVDGVFVEYSFLERSYVDDDISTGPIFLWVFNFPDGLPAGPHIFTGHWSGPCQPFVDEGTYPGPCANPTEVIEIETRSLTVEFLP